MASYVVPQVEIHQLFSEIPAALAQNQVPFVFGPNYLLHRYGAESEKAGTYVGEYDSREQPGYREGEDASATADSPVTSDSSDDSSLGVKYFYPYPGVLDQTQVDKSYTKLFADNVVVMLADIQGVTTVPDKPNELNIPVDAELAMEITRGRKLRLYCLEGDLPSSDSTPEITYAEKIDVTIVDIDPDNSTATNLRIMVDEELDPGLNIYKAALCEIQNGVEIARNDETDPNKENFNWKESYRLVDGVRVDGIEIETQFLVKVNDEDFIRRGVKWGTVLSADMYVTYRELIDSATDAIHTLTYASEVADALGAISPDNPLAQGVYNAALNSGGQIVRYMAVPTNDKEGYSKVLNAATLTKEVYFLVPLTQDPDLLDLVQSHVNDMSAATVKRWRIAFVSAEIPETEAKYIARQDTGGEDFKSIVTSINVAEKTADIQFVVKSGDDWIPNKDTRFKKDLVKDDIYVTKFNHQEWGKYVPQEYRILAILSNNKLRVSDPNGELVVTTEGEKSEIYHPYTNTQKAEVIKNLSSSFADRRMYNIFPSRFFGSGVEQTGEFAAACVAGLVSACLPQQPVTNLELVGIDDIPLTYTTFSTYDLNVMASGGTFIVMQDLPNDQVYIRHQISTDYENNNLNTSELSITKNLDSISFFFDNLLSPYIGKYNITPELIEVLRNVITKGLTSLEMTEWGLYGPQVIAEGTEILLLEQDALLKDHVNCNLKLNLPYPFNHLVLKLFV
jgi:hypothetical protein